MKRIFFFILKVVFLKIQIKQKYIQLSIINDFLDNFLSSIDFLQQPYFWVHIFKSYLKELNKFLIQIKQTKEEKMPTMQINSSNTKLKLNRLIAVADGVGSWNSQGVDPALYAREVCFNIEIFWNRYKKKYEQDAKQLLVDAANATQKEGSSTLVLLILDPSVLKLYATYIGDSSYMILRSVNEKLEIIVISEEQQHSFNFPFQIGPVGDNPEESLSFTYDVQQYDIIVAGSDGQYFSVKQNRLFDNLSPSMIRDIINSFLKQFNLTVKNLRHKQLAALLAQKAFIYSLNESYNSPFSKKAKLANLIYTGGKSDDITVIIASII